MKLLVGTVLAAGICCAHAQPFDLSITVSGLDNELPQNISWMIKPFALQALLTVDDMNGDGVVTPNECLHAASWMPVFGNTQASVVARLDYRVATNQLLDFMAFTSPEEGLSLWMGLNIASMDGGPNSEVWWTTTPAEVHVVVSSVPEPEQWMLLAAGLMLLPPLVRRRPTT